VYGNYQEPAAAVNNIFRPLVCIVLFCASMAAQGAAIQYDTAQVFIAKVIAVFDGDTVLVLRNCETVKPEVSESALRATCGGGHPVKVRLAEIDAPEKAQVFGETSKRSLSDMVLGKQVKVSSQALDKYGRMVAHLSVNGLDVNAEQIRRGMAWEYSHFHRNRLLVALQEEAKQVPRGLWAFDDPMPPWTWRKLHPYDAGDQSHVAATPDMAQPVETTFGFICGSKKYCSEMSSCEEAGHYLTQCGIKTLDGNGDSVPCESLCGGKK
jgi:endonuclease YncB( thermonuclease family)